MSSSANARCRFPISFLQRGNAICMCVCVCVCMKDVCTCAHVCLSACVHARARALSPPPPGLRRHDGTTGLVPPPPTVYVDTTGPESPWRTPRRAILFTPPLPFLPPLPAPFATIFLCKGGVSEQGDHLAEQTKAKLGTVAVYLHPWRLTRPPTFTWPAC
jgi:hypothetical protein